MIRFDLNFESNDLAEVEAIAESVRAVVSRSTLVVRSGGFGAAHRVVVALADHDNDDEFRADLLAVLSVVPPLIHEFDAAGHWRLSRVQERAA